MKRLIPVLAAALAVGACGGGDDEKPANAVSTESYVADVCNAATYWLESMDRIRNDIRDFISAKSGLKERVEVLDGALLDATAEAEAFLTKLRDAGVPDAEDGEEVAAELRRIAERARGAFATAQREARELPTDDRRGFVRGVDRVMDPVLATLDRLGEDFDRLDDTDVGKQLDEECG